LPASEKRGGISEPIVSGVGSGDTGYFDFFWQIFNQNLRLLQLRIDQVECPQ